MRLIQRTLAGLILITLLMTAGAANADENSFSDVRLGRYLVIIGDCVACHSAREGEYLAGGKAIPTPFGTIYSANLTPSIATGIGAWNRNQFVRAMREGRHANGDHLYPAFPYTYFTRVTEEDLSAIWAYLRTIEPVHNEVKEPDLYWPLGWRPLLGGWKWLFFEPGPFIPDPVKSAEWNRGAYLVEGLGHCGACHTPKNIFGAAKKSERFAGSELQQWFAPPLNSDPRVGLGNWSKEDIVRYLQTGTNGTRFAAGLMREVVEKSTQHMGREDLWAIATYLKDLPGDDGQPARETGAHPPRVPGIAPAMARTGPENDEARRQYDSEREDDLGRALYVDNCIGCHRYDGSGMENVFPRLRQSPIVQARNPASLIHVVLRGARLANTAGHTNRIAMPNFDWKLTDEQIAALLTYIRTAWDNDAAAVDSDTVADMREATQLAPDPLHAE